MSNVNRMFRNLIIALAVAAFAIATNAADLKFHSAPGHEPVIGRYLVTLDASVATDVAGASAEALARAYGGQLELFATSDIRKFAIAMLPARARTLSADARVREVVEIPQAEADAAEAPAPSSAVPATSGIARHLVPVTLSASSTGTYLYDGSGNIKSIGPDLLSITDSFDYDIEGRLKHATVQGSLQSYEYDAFGNRMSATRAVNAAPCVHGCEASVTVNHHNNHLGEQSYDDAGNVYSGFGSVYTYDGTGMVTSATVSSDQRDFAYTADDERIAVKQGVTWTWSVRDQGSKVLREFTSLETSSSPLVLGNHTWTKDYVWRDGQLLASVIPSGSSTTTYHYHLDHLGTPRLVTDGNHFLVGKHTYYPFGAEMDLTPKENPIELMKFTGHERDIVAADNATVDYMHARYYNGNLGRFLSVDTVLGKPAQPQSWNRYAYVLNNPETTSDPTGNCGIGFEWLCNPSNIALALRVGNAIGHAALDAADNSSFGNQWHGAESGDLDRVRLGQAQAIHFGLTLGLLPMGASESQTVDTASVEGESSEAAVQPTIRSDVQVSGGRSGQNVKNATGPENSVIRGSEGRVYQTNNKGQIISDITKDRVKTVQPGIGFGEKRPPTDHELDWLARMTEAIKETLK